MNRNTAAANKILYGRSTRAPTVFREPKVSPEQKAKRDQIEEIKFKMNNPSDKDPLL
jgi:hypothetical protein